jgi:hypothetical protein
MVPVNGTVLYNTKKFTSRNLSVHHAVLLCNVKIRSYTVQIFIEVFDDSST